jgi:hypothetical protein
MKVDLEDKICISKHQIHGYSQLSIVIPVVKPNTDYVIRFDGTKITIRVAPFDYKGKIAKAHSLDKKWVTITTKMALPYGHYLIDKEESNEDEIVIYIEDKI